MTRTPVRCAAAMLIGFVPSAVWIAGATSSADGEPIWGLVVAALILGSPVAIAAIVLVDRAAVAAPGRDMPERFLGLATAGLRGHREEWGAAMRAELASIDDPRERRRFAIGCAVTALRVGIGRGQWLVALATGILFALGTYAASRASLAGARTGIVGYTLLVPIPLLFAVGLVAALVRRSFRTGLTTAWLGLVAGLVGMSAMAMVEAGYWYDVAGVYLMDGDAPSGGLSRLDAVLDPVAPSFVVLHVQMWIAWPDIGAATGKWLRHQAVRTASPAGSELR